MNAKTEEGVQMVDMSMRQLTAETDSQRAIAERSPRKEEEIFSAAMKELEINPNFAKVAFYSIPYKDRRKGVTTYVEGNTIKAAMSLTRRWGNCSVGARIADQTEERILVDGVFVDYETNVRILKTVPVPRGYIEKKTGDFIPYNSDRLNQAILIGASKAARNAILAGLPAYLTDAYFAKAKEIAAKLGKKKKAPFKTRIAEMTKSFVTLGVSSDVLAEYLKKEPVLADKSNDDIIAHMIGVFNGIKEKSSTVIDVFGDYLTEGKKPGDGGQINMSDLTGGEEDNDL